MMLFFKTLARIILATAMTVTCISSASADVVIRETESKANGEANQIFSSRSFLSNENQEVLINQDFSGCVSHLSDSIRLDMGKAMLDPKMIGEKNWWGQCVYSSDGAVALAFPGWGGLIATPYMDMYGEVTVSFRYRVRPGNKQKHNFWVNFVKGTPKDVNHLDYDDITKHCCIGTYSPGESEEGWKEFSFTCLNDYKGLTSLQVNAQFLPNAGIEIDDLKVTRNKNFIMAPNSIKIKEIFNDGFTAYWRPGAENRNYLVNCIEERTVSEQTQTYSESFKSTSLPDKWVGEGCSVVPAKGYNGDNAVEMSLGQTLRLPLNYSKITDMKFSVRCEGIKDQMGMSVIALKGLTSDGRWVSPSQVMLSFIPKDGMVIELSEQAPNFLQKGFMGFALEFMNINKDEEPGKIYLSNFNWVTDGNREREVVVMKTIDEHYLTVRNLKSQHKYFLQVAGVNGSLVSPFSSLTEVVGVEAPSNLCATDVSVEKNGYTASWSNVGNANSGYEVSNYTVTKITRAEKNYLIMKDNFTKFDSPTLTWIDKYNLDEYTEMPGWTMENKPGQIGGMAGIGANQLSGSPRAIITSPEVQLQNNNGEFTIEFILGGNGPLDLEVTAGGETQTVSMPWNYDFETHNEFYGEKQVRMTFHSGDVATRIQYSSPNWRIFSIKNFRIIQDVEVDDLIYTLEDVFETEDGVTRIDIENKTKGFHSFGVRSRMTRNDTERYVSPMIMSGLVDANSGQIDCVEEFSLKLGTEEGRIWVDLSADNSIEVYSIAGVLTCKIDGKAGRNFTSQLSSGIYIVRCREKSFKIII